MQCPDVDALENSITDWQARDWMTFFAIEPWGSEIGWYQTGIIAATIANSAPNRKKSAKAARPADFIPKFGQRKKRSGMDPKQVKAELFGAFGSRIVDKRKKKGGADGGGNQN